MFKKSIVVANESEFQRIVDTTLRCLQKQISCTSSIIKLEYENTDGPVQTIDLFDQFHEDIFGCLADEPIFYLPYIEHDCSKVEDARLQTYSYLFQLGIDVEIHLAPVVYRGKKGMMLHQLDWHKSFPKDGGDYTGFINAQFVAFIENGHQNTSLHSLWKLMDQIYQSKDKHFNLGLCGTTGAW